MASSNRKRDACLRSLISIALHVLFFTMEIHHKSALAEGGTNTLDNFDFMTWTEHRLGPNYKKHQPNLP
jgi:hypothetical protein